MQYLERSIIIMNDLDNPVKVIDATRFYLKNSSYLNQILTQLFLKSREKNASPR